MTVFVKQVLYLSADQDDPKEKNGPVVEGESVSKTNAEKKVTVEGKSVSKTNAEETCR